jgi:hypothetical protein
VALVAGAVIVLAPNSDTSTQAEYRIVVNSNPDDLVTIPQLANAVGNYVTKLPIDQIPPPPGRRDGCLGRYSWAHTKPISAVDAEATLVKIDITAKARPLLLDGADIHFDNSSSKALAGTLLACPGGGGSAPSHLLLVNLDYGGRMRYFPNGGNTPGNLNLNISRGQTESLLVLAQALTTYCRWRLELRLDDGSQIIAVTVGPHGSEFGRAVNNPGQREFATTGDYRAKPFRFQNNHWRPTR